MNSELERLRLENEQLSQRVHEAEAMIQALRAGEVDALFVEGHGQRVFTLEAADEPYRLLVERVPQASATLTPAGEIIHCNKHFGLLVDRSREELVGRSLQELVDPASQPVLEQLLREPGEVETVVDLTLRGSDDAAVLVSFGVQVVREGPFGSCLMFTDLTEARRFRELQRAQEALRATRERLELAQDAGRIASFEWSAESGRMSWSRTGEVLYGRPADELALDLDAWLLLVHPDDRALAGAAFRGSVCGEAELDTDFRIVRADGETRWVAAKGRLFPDPGRDDLRLLGVTVDITERRRTEEALRQADRRKDQFLATLAHELRNPLAPIRNAVELLKQAGLRPEDRQRTHAVLDRQVGLMTRLLEDLLDVSRISRDTLELRKERVGLSAVLDAAQETSRPVLEASCHELEVELPPEEIHLVADPVRLSQVFANLLNNAAKYTEQGGKIRLSAWREGDEVVVSVRDSGIGIDPAVLPRVFEIFSQAKPASIRSPDGLGIGLSLVKGVVELHGGSVEACSSGLGQGSDFRVRLRVEASQAPPALPDGPEAPVRTARRVRVLVVDDNRDSADTLAIILRREQHEVQVAYEGEQALRLAAASRPDFVILDLGMPVMNGYEICRELRRQPWSAATTIVALTGWGQLEDRARTSAAGFDHHLVKPARLEQLRSLIGARDARRDGTPC